MSFGLSPSRALFKPGNFVRRCSNRNLERTRQPSSNQQQRFYSRAVSKQRRLRCTRSICPTVTRKWTKRQYANNVGDVVLEPISQCPCIRGVLWITSQYYHHGGESSRYEPQCHCVGRTNVLLDGHRLQLQRLGRLHLHQILFSEFGGFEPAVPAPS